MKLDGFIGPAYTLDSVNVDCQRCVNLYPEVIESGRGKEGQVAYLRGTPGLKKIANVGDGPIRLIHVDSIGRIFVVSGNKLYVLSTKKDWRFIFNPVEYEEISIPDASGAVDTSTNVITFANHGFYTGLKVRLTTLSALPSPLAVDTDYWVIKVDDNKFKIASTFANAVGGTEIDLTSTGASVMNVIPQIPGALINVLFSGIDFAANSFKKNSHGFTSGLEVTVKASGLFPVGLDSETTYFVTNETENSFQLATSVANAASGTSIDLNDIADQWLIKLVGANGMYGGDPVLLETSEGHVKASSMSFQGEGEDSSTIFVDGVNNYLYLNDTSSDYFGTLGATIFSKAVLDVDDDITVSIHEDYQDYAGYLIRVSAWPLPDSGQPWDLSVSFFKTSVTNPGDVIIDIEMQVKGYQSITTAQFVELLNTGSISGKVVLAGDLHGLLPLLSASGGGTEYIEDAFGGFGKEGAFVVDGRASFGYTAVPTATQIVWSDGYFILNEAGTNRFWVSDLKSFNVGTLSFASSEGDPDILLALAINNRHLYALNKETTEIYANVGNPDFPFERVQGGLIEVGLAAEYSVAKVAGTILWLGRTKDGQGIVYAAKGSTPQIVSTHAIEQAIRGYSDISTATAFAYQDGGHNFYVLNFDEATWVYDLSTGLWHERAFTREGDLERHRAQYHIFDPNRGIHVVGDYETNEVYELSEEYYSDNGHEITGLRSSPHISSSLNRIFYHRFQLDMEVGVGLDGDVQGSDPKVMLDWSNDGGHTWSSEMWAQIDAGAGQIGDFKKRVIFNRLGSARDRVFRAKITDPVKRRFIAAIIDFEKGAS